jgi:RNA polymerase sigma-70 factor, ECF subfamily
MPTSEPERSWQNHFHDRILHKDATAFAEFCELALPPLASFLCKQFPQVESQVAETVAIDCLLGYYANPAQYKTGGISLYAYLRMAARYDLINALNRAQRTEKRLASLDELETMPDLQEMDIASSTREMDEILHKHTRLSFPEILGRLDKELDQTEKQVLWLMLQGERNAGAYTGILGIEYLDEREQRSEVARVKDRLIKKLRRFGKSLK